MRALLLTLRTYRRIPFTIAMLSILALMIGCATMPKVPLQPQRTSAIIPAPKESVWPLLVTEVGLNYPVQVIEKDSGLLTTQFVQMPMGFNNMNMQSYVFAERCLFCTWGGLRMNMSVMAVESEPGKTQVTINAHYEAFENNVSKSWIVVPSNGAVENQILTNVEQKLQLEQELSDDQGTARHL